MAEHFNKLTPAEAERLAMLAEEAGEIVQMVGKILRHGYESYHPNDCDKTTNRILLMSEIKDLIGVVGGMAQANDLPLIEEGDIEFAWDRKLIHSHHQS